MFFLFAYVIEMLCWKTCLCFEIDYKCNHVTNIVVVELWLLLCFIGHHVRNYYFSLKHDYHSGISWSWTNVAQNYDDVTLHGQVCSMQIKHDWVCHMIGM